MPSRESRRWARRPTPATRPAHAAADAAAGELPVARSRSAQRRPSNNGRSRHRGHARRQTGGTSHERAPLRPRRPHPAPSQSPGRPIHWWNPCGRSAFLAPILHPSAAPRWQSASIQPHPGSFQPQRSGTRLYGRCSHRAPAYGHPGDLTGGSAPTPRSPA